MADFDSDTVTPIDTATNTAGTPIPVGTAPFGIAITPNGTTAYVANNGSNNGHPRSTIATNTAGTPIPVGTAPVGIAITPDGTTAYVANAALGTVTPITIATNTAGTPIPVGSIPDRHRHHPERHDRLRGQQRLQHGDPDRHRHQHRRHTHHRREPPLRASPSPRTARPPMWPTAVSNTVTPITPPPTPPAPHPRGELPLGVAITPDQAPVASFTAAAAPAGSATSFDASASSAHFGTIASYAWSFGDGTNVDHGHADHLPHLRRARVLSPSP